MTKLEKVVSWPSNSAHGVPDADTRVWRVTEFFSYREPFVRRYFWHQKFAERWARSNSGNLEWGCVLLPRDYLKSHGYKKPVELLKVFDESAALLVADERSGRSNSMRMNAPDIPDDDGPGASRGRPEVSVSATQRSDGKWEIIMTHIPLENSRCQA